jgi:hypothetical protein
MSAESVQWRIVCTYAAVDAICPNRPGPWEPAAWGAAAAGGACAGGWAAVEADRCWGVGAGFAAGAVGRRGADPPR